MTLNPLEWIWKRPPTRVGRRRHNDVRTALAGDYAELLRLAGQIRAHGALAPYAYVRDQLSQMAQGKEERAALLRAKVAPLGDIGADQAAEPYVGRNHWERMVRDLEEQRDLEDQLVSDLIFAEEKSPEIGELLREIIAGERADREVLAEMLAKADPQATQS